MLQSSRFAQSNVSLLVQLSGREEEEAATALGAQLATADLRRNSLEKRNALLEGFIGLTPQQVRLKQRNHLSQSPVTACTDGGQSLCRGHCSAAGADAFIALIAFL